MTWSEREEPDRTQRQAIGAGFGRVESLPRQVVVDGDQGVEREDRPARQIQRQPGVEPALQQDENAVSTRRMSVKRTSRFAMTFSAGAYSKYIF